MNNPQPTLLRGVIFKDAIHGEYAAYISKEPEDGDDRVGLHVFYPSVTRPVIYRSQVPHDPTGKKGYSYRWPHERNSNA